MQSFRDAKIIALLLLPNNSFKAGINTLLTGNMAMQYAVIKKSYQQNHSSIKKCLWSEKP